MRPPPSRSHFSLSLKTHSSFGLIFYVSDAQEDNFMALFLAHGKLVYTFNVADQRVKIRSEEKFNDGAWHNVSSQTYSICQCWVDARSVTREQFLQWRFISLLLLKVVFIRDGRMGRLIIDGLTVLEDRAQGGNISWHVSSPLYVGGVPPEKAQKNIQVWIQVYQIRHTQHGGHLKCKKVNIQGEKSWIFFHFAFREQSQNSTLLRHFDFFYI